VWYRGGVDEGWLERRFLQTQARTADQRPHRVRFFRTERRRADLHPHRRLLTDVVPEAQLEEPGRQSPPDPGPGGGQWVHLLPPE
jgi:hypothetical protein